jgi:hypothetical protein
MDNTSVRPIIKEIIIPEGNYSINELYLTFTALLNGIADETGWVVSKFDIEPNTNKCIIQWQRNGDFTTGQNYWPNFVLGYGLDGGLRAMAHEDWNVPLPNAPQSENDPFYSIMLWMLGKQKPSLKHKDMIGKYDLVATYDPLSFLTTLTYTSPTIPQASFDTSLYLVSEYFNNSDQTIYEDVTDPSGETDLDVTGANISDIWLKIPTSFYNFGDRVWYWPKTPYTFNMLNSNQDVDIRIVDLFNRRIELNNGNFNLHLVFYFSRDTNFI